MAALAALAAPAAVANPVVPGDHPDPTLLRTPDGWYASSTSTDWLPAFPVLFSPDLEHWRQVGSILRTRPRWAAEDFWAPELAVRDGNVLAYYAAKGRDGRRCVAVASAPAPTGPYRDHGPLICSRVGEIDPLPVRDEHGADWLVWKRDGNSRGLPTPLLAAPLAPGGMSLAAPPRELFQADAPWEHGLIEAPALVRRGGFFYLVYSAGRCCGRHCNYATGVARAIALLGPWEKRPAPILTGGAGLRCPGHVGIAPGPAGDPLLAYHAYVRGDPSNRQLLVAPLHFDAEGWPAVEPVRPTLPRPPDARFGFGRRLGLGWEWPAGPRPDARVTGGRLALARGALARQTGTTHFIARTVVVPHSGSARPGLAVMPDGDNSVGIELRGSRAVAWRSDDGLRMDVGALDVGSPRVELRVVAGARVRLELRSRGRWRGVGGPQPPPRWAAGARVALTVRGGPGARGEFGRLWIDSR